MRDVVHVLAENGVLILAAQSAVSPSGSTVERDTDDQILEMIERGETLQAIALLRESKGMGLSEAKSFVDDLTDRPAA